MTNSLLVCIPSLHTWEADTAICWANVNGSLHKYPIFDKVGFINARSSDLVTSRTVMARQAISDKYTHTFWFDSDMTFPQDIIHKLFSHNVDIVGAIGRVKCDDYRTFALNDNGSFLSPLEHSGLQEVSFIGFGCILIKTSVFENLGEPWFGGWWGTKEHQLEWNFEDHYFCDQAKQAGHKILVDCEASNYIGHIGSCVYHHQGVMLIR